MIFGSFHQYTCKVIQGTFPKVLIACQPCTVLQPTFGNVAKICYTCTVIQLTSANIVIICYTCRHKSIARSTFPSWFPLLFCFQSRHALKLLSAYLPHLNSRQPSVLDCGIITSNQSFRFFWLASDAVGMSTRSCQPPGNFPRSARAAVDLLTLPDVPFPSQVVARPSPSSTLSPAPADFRSRLVFATSPHLQAPPLNIAIFIRPTDTSKGSFVKGLCTSSKVLSTSLEVPPIGSLSPNKADDEDGQPIGESVPRLSLSDFTSYFRSWVDGCRFLSTIVTASRTFVIVRSFHRNTALGTWTRCIASWSRCSWQRISMLIYLDSSMADMPFVRSESELQHIRTLCKLPGRLTLVLQLT